MKRSLLFVGILFFSMIVLSGDNYHFAVLGDRTGGANQDAFEMVLKDIKRLHPDFLITVGDQIEGYTDRETAEREWDEIFKSAEILSCPVFYIPGNHDIYNSESRKVFIEKTGLNPYYTFDYGNSHFIVLNNAIYDSYDDMSEEQKFWLIQDLKNIRGKENIYVFMHKPFWAGAVGSGREDKMHDIFKKYNVDAVFTGHWHQYASNEIDGIRYILVGSSGGDYGGMENEGLGLFYQFLWCKVEDGKLYPSLIKAGNTYDVDHVSVEEEQLSYEIESELIKATGEYPVGRNDGKIKVNLSIINKTRKVLRDKIRWSVCKNWKVTPEEKAVKIEPGDTLIEVFDFFKEGDFYPLPVLSFNYTFGRNKLFKYESPVTMKKKLKCSLTEEIPEIDGKMRELLWERAVSMDDFSGFDGNKSEVKKTRIKMATDGENLFAIAECGEERMEKLTAEYETRDEPVYDDDCLGFLFSADGKTVYHIYINARGTIWDKKVDLVKGEQDVNWNVKGDFSTHKGKDGWYMEFSIPLGELGMEKDERLLCNVRRKQQWSGKSALWLNDWSYNAENYGMIIINEKEEK